ncbi:MAG: sigma-70 family RNA polymerase sigma factor [Planctomycetales bacterium]|nr:sigma-70 family RNA polymerase sigma factor [Planctomycetales bacterium]
MDALLLPQIACGEETAVHQCLDRYGDLIWSLARRLLPTSADAEDAVQEIFVDIWQNAERFDQEIASEKTFVVMLARRRLIDRRRKLGRSVQGQPIDEAALERPDRQQVDTVELADEAARANRCMEKLHQDQRCVLELAIYHGLSQSQISAHVGAPLGTVKARVRRGLIHLRDCMNVPKKLVGGAG